MKGHLGEKVGGGATDALPFDESSLCADMMLPAAVTPFSCSGSTYEDLRLAILLKKVLPPS